jgi:hypothetical protein
MQRFLIGLGLLILLTELAWPWLGVSELAAFPETF